MKARPGQNNCHIADTKNNIKKSRKISKKKCKTMTYVFVLKNSLKTACQCSRLKLIFFNKSKLKIKVKTILKNKTNNKIMT